MKTEPTKNLIQIQEEFIETVNSGFSRWYHRKPMMQYGGHFNRIYRGAYHKAEKALAKWEFNKEQIREILKDAVDMSKLIRFAESE